MSGHRKSLRRRGLPRRVDEEETTGRRPRWRPNVVTEMGARCGDTEASLSSTGKKYSLTLTKRYDPVWFWKFSRFLSYGVWKFGCLRHHMNHWFMHFKMYLLFLLFQVSGHGRSLRRRGLPRRVDEEETTGRRPRWRLNVVTELGARCGDQRIVVASVSSTGEKYFHMLTPRLMPFGPSCPLLLQLVVSLDLSVFTTLLRCFPVLSGRFGVFRFCPVVLMFSGSVRSFWCFPVLSGRFGVFPSFRYFRRRFWFFSRFQVFAYIYVDNYEITKFIDEPRHLQCSLLYVCRLLLYHTIDHATSINSLLWAPIELYWYE